MYRDGFFLSLSFLRNIELTSVVNRYKLAKFQIMVVLIC